MELPRGRTLLKYGTILFSVGVGPLLLIIAAAKLGLLNDPDPNPIGPGLLAMLAFWPSIALLILGAGMILYERFSGRADPTALDPQKNKRL